MELVYLWVEGYKNIHKQGFNFSPRFECDYKNGNLIICDKTKNEYLDKENQKCIKCEDRENNYIQNFFGDNINVTAIVGKNGSGKSNLLDLIFDKHSDIPCKEHFCIVDDKKGLQLYLFEYRKLKLIKKIKTNTLYPLTSLRQDAKDDTPTEKEYKFSSLFFSNTFQDLSIHDELSRKNQKDISTSFLIYDYSREEYPFSNKDEFKDFKSQYNLYKSKSIANSIHMLREKNIKLPFKEPIELHISVKFLPTIDEKDTLLKTFQKLREENTTDTSLFYRYVLEALIYRHEINSDHKYSFLDDNETNIEDIYKEVYSDNNEAYKGINNFLKSLKKICQKMNENDFVLRLNIKDIDQELMESMWEMSNSFVSQWDIFYFSWEPELSTGQETFLFQFANFYTHLKEIENDDNIIISIDEGDTTLHPNWQKKYVKYYIDFLKNNFKEKNIHLIFTTHSPFLLSDIPKENVIFLDTYKKDEDSNQEEGNCKVIDGLKNKQQTFGANIHTLLSDGFFMDEGLMGEFAKGKINEIKKFYELIQKLKKRMEENHRTKELARKSFIKRQDRFSKVQKIIGEPFLKTIIGNYLDELHLIFSDDKTLIDKELQEIEARKQYLEELKNAKN